MKNTQITLSEIKNQRYDLDFSHIFNESFEIYKRTALFSGLAIMLFTIIILGIVFSLMGIFFGFEAFTQSMTDFKAHNLSAIYIVVYVLGTSLLSGLMVPFTAGMIQMAHEGFSGEEVSIGTAFRFYKGSHFAQLFVAGFLISAFTMGISTAIDSLENPIISLLGGLISLIISFLTLLTIPLIIFGNLNATDAIQGSMFVVMKSPLIILGLVIVAGILSIVGFIGLCIGLFFTLPFIYATYYSIYRNSVGIEQTSEIDQIGSEQF